MFHAVSQQAPRLLFPSVVEIQLIVAARAIYNLFGMKNEAQHMDTTIVLMFTTSKQLQMHQ